MATRVASVDNAYITKYFFKYDFGRKRHFDDTQDIQGAIS